MYEQNFNEHQYETLKKTKIDYHNLKQMNFNIKYGFQITKFEKYSQIWTVAPIFCQKFKFSKITAYTL